MLTKHPITFLIFSVQETKSPTPIAPRSSNICFPAFLCEAINLRIIFLSCNFPSKHYSSPHFYLPPFYWEDKRLFKHKTIQSILSLKLYEAPNTDPSKTISPKLRSARSDVSSPIQKGSVCLGVEQVKYSDHYILDITKLPKSLRSSPTPSSLLSRIVNILSQNSENSGCALQNRANTSQSSC